MKLHDRLILNKYLLSLFGVEKFADFNIDAKKKKNLRDILYNIEQETVFLEIGQYGNALLHSDLNIESDLKDNLEKYDDNIEDYLESINEKRDNPIKLTYFQYLSILFTEVYLDRYYNNRVEFLSKMNNFIDIINNDMENDEEKYPHYLESNLNRLAYYMATGSGKTIIMHINYLQFKRYCNDNINNIILITPNSRLSNQHIEEFHISNINAEPFIDNLMNKYDKDTIYILEITKLVKNKNDEGESIEISSLENNNLVFVDEGHRGSTGDIWKSNRDEIAKKGFIIEYSATLGQAVEKRIDQSNKWKNESDYYNQKVEEINLNENIKKEIFQINKNDTYIKISKYMLEQKLVKYLDEDEINNIQVNQVLDCYESNFENYSKSIIFDYSYKYFHGDGYGKDYNILNLKSENVLDYNEIYLLGNLLSFYEQKLYFNKKEDEIRDYMMEKPLQLFVGATVNTGTSKVDKESISDVGFILKFIDKFIQEKSIMTEIISDIIGKKSGIYDLAGNDVFADSYIFLKEKNYDSEKIYLDILNKIFNCKNETKGQLVLYDIKNGDGEIALKIKGENEYFGLINIGEVSTFKNHLREHDFLLIMDDEYTKSFFESINDEVSSINILIGSRKFSEGWNSFRVSSIGLLNMGRTEGSQIIQIFGRGVRLRGYDGCLKRSNKVPVRLKDNHPKNINVLETLNVFGIRADYMKNFEEYLRSEDIETESSIRIPLKVKPNKKFIEEDLTILKIADGINFKQDKNIILESVDEVTVEIDLRPKVERLSIKKDKGTGDLEKNPIIIQEGYIYLCDWDKIYLEIIKYKRTRGYWNLLIYKDILKRIISEERYKLYGSERFTSPTNFDGVNNLENIIIRIIKKYIEAFYRFHRLKYEDKHIVYDFLDEKHSNFKDYNIYIKEANVSLIDEIKNIIKNENIYENEFKRINNIYLDRHLFQPLLSIDEDFISIPVGLNKYEKRFIEDLKKYSETEQFSKVCKNKKMFLLRNLSIGNGIGFFEADNFHPDFILWIKDNEENKQYITFIDPKGIRMLGSINHPKIKLSEKIKIRQNKLKEYKGYEIILNSFILSNTTLNEAKKLEGAKEFNRDDFLNENILFSEKKEEDIHKLFKKILEE